MCGPGMSCSGRDDRPVWMDGRCQVRAKAMRVWVWGSGRRSCSRVRKVSSTAQRATSVGGASMKQSSQTAKASVGCFGSGFVCGRLRHRRTEGAAGHGAGGVEVAGAGGGVEDGADGVVGEIFEGFFVVGFCEEEAGCGVAGEVFSESVACGGGAIRDACGKVRSGGLEGFAESCGVEGRDGEDADAALRTAGSAGHPGSGAAVAVGEGGVGDLDEGGVGWHSCFGGGEAGPHPFAIRLRKDGPPKGTMLTLRL